MEPFTNTTPRATVAFVFFFLALSFLVSFNSCVDPTLLFDVCPNTTLFHPKSTYQFNLNILLSSLSSKAKSNAYHNAIVGRSPNAVYGNYYCRGDDTSDVCCDCVNAAVRQIVQDCPNRKVGYIWYEECTLRYSNQSFSNVSEFPAFFMWDVVNASDPTLFNQLLEDTINKAAIEAASNSEKYATQVAKFTHFQKLCCLAQCSPDLSGDDCSRCLVDAISGLPSCCGGKQGGRVVNPSCNVRFEVYPFYRVTASAPSPSPALFSPPPVLVSPPPAFVSPLPTLVSPPPAFVFPPPTLISPPPASIGTIITVELFGVLNFDYIRSLN